MRPPQWARPGVRPGSRRWGAGGGAARSTASGAFGAEQRGRAASREAAAAAGASGPVSGGTRHGQGGQRRRGSRRQRGTDLGGEWRTPGGWGSGRGIVPGPLRGRNSAGPTGCGGGEKEKEREIRFSERAPRRGFFQQNPPAPRPFSFFSLPRWRLRLQEHNVHLKLWGTNHGHDMEPPLGLFSCFPDSYRAIGNEMMGMAIMHVCLCGLAFSPNMA